MKREIALRSLPDDIIMDILSCLPAKSIKLWLGRFKTPDFINKHLNHAVENNKYNIFLTTLDTSFRQTPPYYRVDFDEASATSLSDKAVKINLPTFSSSQGNIAANRRCVGSCNGIFCFSSYILDDSVTISLWNPFTQEFKEIVYKKPHNGEVLAYGFGYDCKINDYKLILIFKNGKYSKIDGMFFHTFSEIHVYTLGSSSWKIIPGKSTYAVDYGVQISMKLLNGAMHLVARKVIVTSKEQTVNMAVILSFDIAEDTTKEIQIPSCFLDERYYFWNERVGVLGKDLYFSVHHISNMFDLWVMKDYGHVDSWTKLLSIPEVIENVYNRETLLFYNANRQILFNCRSKHYKSALVSYDLGNGTLTFFNTCDAPENFIADTFIESLVSFKSSECA